MSKLVWDKVGEKTYESGVENGVLYPQDSNGAYPLGVAWNGLTSVSENPSGAEANPIYADNIKYLNLLSAEEFAATIEAYTYPEEFEECDGSADLVDGVTVGQQPRKSFGMVYKTGFGNDVDGISYGYKLHIIYGALASPSEKNYQTINDSPEAIAFSWDVSTTPVNVTGHKPTASIVINSKLVDADKLAALELVLFGDDGVDPRLPLPDEVKSIIDASPDAIELSSSDPADEDTDVAIDTTIEMTFNNKIVQEQITVVSSAGAVVAGALTWDSAGKVATFTPDSDLSNNTIYIVTVHGVVDMYGQLLATEAFNFTTIAA
jgi:hypothetical protein